MIAEKDTEKNMLAILTEYDSDKIREVFGPRLEKQLRVFSELYDELGKISEKEEEIHFDGKSFILFTGRRLERKFIGKINDGCNIHCNFFAYLDSGSGLSAFLGLHLSVTFRFALCGDHATEYLDDWTKIVQRVSDKERLEISDTYFPKFSSLGGGPINYISDIEMKLRPPLSESIAYKIFSSYREKMGID